MSTDVQTIDYCSPIDKIEEKFNKECVGKDKCYFDIDIS